MKCPRLVLIAVPLGTLIGQVVVVIGLAMDDGLFSGTLLVFGWLLVCACRAGGEVVQHTSLVQCMPNALTSGFVVLIFFTHLSYVFCNVVVPRILSVGAGSKKSVLDMQLVLLIPGVLSVVAACVLACIQLSVRNSSGNAHRRVSEQLEQLEAPFTCQLCARSFVWSEWIPKSCRYLILWNGLVVGILHAFQSVTNSMCTNFGLSLVDAGQLIAWNQITSLVVLPLAGILGDSFSHLNEILIVVLSAASFCSAFILTLQTIISVPTLVWEGALLLLQVVGILAPVVSLALVPRYTKRIGEAFGVVDSLKSTFQCVFVLLIGALRQNVGGFHTALLAVCTGLGVLSVVSGLFFYETKRRALQQDEVSKDVVALGA
jgi:hypothetical protein